VFKPALDGSTGIEMTPLGEVPLRDDRRQERVLDERDDMNARLQSL
jgi:hypothetical protein